MSLITYFFTNHVLRYAVVYPSMPLMCDIKVGTDFMDHFRSSYVCFYWSTNMIALHNLMRLKDLNVCGVHRVFLFPTTLRQRCIMPCTSQLGLWGSIVVSYSYIIYLYDTAAKHFVCLVCQEMHAFEESPNRMFDFFAIQAMLVFKILKIRFFKFLHMGWYVAWWYNCNWWNTLSFFLIVFFLGLIMKIFVFVLTKGTKCFVR